MTTTTLNSASTAASKEEAHSWLLFAWRSFKSHHLALLGGIMIILMTVLALLAPAIEHWSGHSPFQQDIFHRFEKPFSRVDLSFLEKKKALTEYFHQNPQQAKVIASILQKHPLWATRDLDSLPSNLALMSTESLNEKIPELHESLPPEFMILLRRFQRSHWLGTDELGRDVFIRLVYGTRVSLGVGLFVALISALIGLIIGCLAGYYGGRLDAILMRFTDSLLALPLLPVLIVIAAIDFAKVPLLNLFITPSNQAVMKLVVILCLFTWMGLARLVRSQMLTLREREFVLAAKAIGANDLTIILRHGVPNVLAPLMVSVTLGVGEAILFEAALSYLGLGIQPPLPSWGNMLFNAQEIIYHAPWLALLPGFLILLTTLSFNSIGDGLQKAIDPKNLMS